MLSRSGVVRSRNPWSAVFGVLAAVGLMLVSSAAQAVCSSYQPLANINEVHETGAAGSPLAFVEVKVLDDQIGAAIYDDWSLEICDSKGSCTGWVSLSRADDSTYPWVVLTEADFDRKTINIKKGMSIRLRDSAGDTIDFLTVGGVTYNEDPSCTLDYDFDFPGGNNTQTIRRIPDGTGDWDDAGSGNSGDTTTGDSNTGGGTGLSIDDAYVFPGDTAVFTLTLDTAQSSDVSVNFRTLEYTARAGVDYTAVSGTATIPAGATSTTASVSTLASSDGGVSFYLRLTDASGAYIGDHFGQGFIIAAPAAYLPMDESRWSGAAGEVADDSGNGFDGTAANGLSTAGTDPALAGDPGTCRYGEFDGRDDYVELDSSFPNLTGDFTLTAWIRPDDVSGANNDQRIFADDEHNAGGYALSLSDGGDGRLRFFSRSVNPVSLDSGNVVQAGQWQFVAAVHDASTKTRRIYLNGSLVAEDTYSGSWGTDPGAASIGGETDAAGSEAVPRWRFQGLIDEVRVFRAPLTSGELNAVRDARHPCPNGPVVDHYAISHATTGVTCVASPVTFTAMDAANNPVDPGTATIDLSTLAATGASRGTWSAVLSGSGTLSDPDPGNGTASYVFPGGESSVTLAFDYPNPVSDPETVDIDVTDGSVRESSAQDPALEIATAGFIFTNDTAGNQTIPVQIAGKWTNQGHAPINLGLQAVKASEENTSVCVAAFPANTDVTVELGAECRNPSACAGGQVRVRDVKAATAVATSADNGAQGAAGYSAVSLRFDPDGNADAKAPIDIEYPDAGQIQLHARWEIPREDGTGSGRYMVGSSMPFVVRPFGLDIDFGNDRRNNGTSGSSYAADATGSVFTTAGTDFDTTLTAVGWQAGDDSDGDGVPDPGANLTDNPTTPNFGNESGAEPVDVTHSLVAPTGGATGTLTVNGATTGGGDITGFSAGAVTVPVSWSEVGIIDLIAGLNDGDYLGSNEDVVGRVRGGNVGRFRPDHFTTAVASPTTGVFDNACTTASGFTYTGEPFGYLADPGFTAEPRAATGQLTRNYRGAFNRLVQDGIVNLGLPTTGTDDGNGLRWQRSPGTVSLSGNADGTTAVSLTGDSYQYVKNPPSTDPDPKVAPFSPDIGLALQSYRDSDGVAASDLPQTLAVDGSSAEIRYGRLELGNAHGSERVDLTVPLLATYFDGVGYRTNDLDSCTGYDSSYLAVEGGFTTASGAGTLVLGRSDPNNPVQLAAPGAGNTGRVTVMYCLDAAGAVAPCPATGGNAGLPWLRSDWPRDGNTDGVADDDPYGLATFGVFHGADGQIYRRELY
ncbi:MAG: hypothetical protein PVF40_00535 [Ectothiorhodospiraceae bacterium]